MSTKVTPPRTFFDRAGGVRIKLQSGLRKSTDLVPIVKALFAGHGGLHPAGAAGEAPNPNDKLLDLHKRWGIEHKQWTTMEHRSVIDFGWDFRAGSLDETYNFLQSSQGGQKRRGIARTSALSRFHNQLVPS